MQKPLSLILLLLCLCGCGVETVGAAATAASVKKQEVDQGKQDMARFQQQLDQANQASQQRAAALDGAGK